LTRSGHCERRCAFRIVLLWLNGLRDWNPSRSTYLYISFCRLSRTYG
jgi:hypothetical protein